METTTLNLFHVIFDSIKATKGDLDEGLSNPRLAIARPGDITRSCLIVEKARTGLGWQPKTSLVDGIKATLEWYTKQH